MTYDPSKLWKTFWSPSRIETACKEKLERSLWRNDKAYTLIAQACDDAVSVLDLGCGGGVQYEAIRESVKGVCYEGVDISKEALGFARKRYPGVAFRELDIRDLPYEDDSFSVVIIRHVLEHHSPSDVAVIVREAVRVAKSKVLVLFFKCPGKKARIGKNPAGFYINTYSAEWVMALFKSIETVGEIGRQRIARTKKSPAYTVQDLWTISLSS